jgi:hypothetical protein
MNRFNLFNQIHKGLRAMLYDAALAIGRTDFTQAGQAAATLTRLERVLFFFDAHAEHENKFILPAIRQHNPYLLDAFAGEHEADHKLANELRELIGLYQLLVQPEMQIQLGQQLFYAFNAFVAFNLEHMNREESTLNQVLWEHYTDAQLHGIEAEIVRSIAPAELAEESRWMMRAINQAEAVAWLSGAHDTAPEPVFQFLLQLARQELPAEQWIKVQVALKPAGIP